ncbi:MAG TPA: hypothetical protein VKU19_22780 [Bryobacteraceae bacterium]|nr:hypothetical protein [Bryobacteraceae bacterium]
MTLSYVFRLLCLCLATFFLVNLVLGLAVRAATAAAVRWAERMPARAAAHWLLALRLAPPAIALFVVAALCVPSYLWLEPEAASEEIGVPCLLAAVLGAMVWILAMVRSVRIAARSSRYVDAFQRAGVQMKLRGCRLPVWMVGEGSASLMLAGVLRPRIFVAQRVMAALTPEQFEAAVRHEVAHLQSHDNSKRVLLLFAPGLLPFFRGLDSLETHWSRIAEWAADDRSVEGDAQRSLALASALVRVARLAPAACPVPMIASLFQEGRDLAARVDRLLNAAPVRSKRRFPMIPAGGAVLLASLAAMILQPTTFHSVHRLLEELIH